MSDNGPQFVSQAMKEFAALYGLSLVTSSPHYPQSNGLAERTIQTVKGLSTAQLQSHSNSMVLIQPSTASDAPKSQLIRQWPYLADFQEKDREYKAKQKRDYNERHRTRPLDPLLPDAPVWIRTENNQTIGHIRSQANTPRSYNVATCRELRRTRQHLSYTDTQPLWSSLEAT